MNKKLLVFDLDGTLIDSKLDIANSVNEALVYCDLPKLPIPQITAYIGNGVPHLIRSALGENETEQNYENAVSRFRSYYYEHLLDQTVLYPAVKKTLKKLGDYSKVLFTNKPGDYSLKILEGLGISSFFLEVIGSDSKFPKKPNPAGLIHLIEKHSSTTDTSLIIGDSSLDIQTGKSAGVETCAVSYGFVSRSELIKFKPDYLIDRFSDLLKII